MVILAVYLVSEGGLVEHRPQPASGETLSFAASIPVMITAIAIVVSYFSGPMLNFGDFSRYGRSFEAVKRGNFLGLPINFLFFSLLTVITASATVPVFGELITDPIETVQQIDTPFAILLGGLTFVTATVGINIVANFISPAFDFSNVSPQKISWRTGGMIAAVGSVILTPWNWYNNARRSSTRWASSAASSARSSASSSRATTSRPSSASRWTTCTRSIPRAGTGTGAASTPTR